MSIVKCLQKNGYQIPKIKKKRRQARRKWYANNKPKSCDKVKKRKQELREWFGNYKQQLECEMCGEDHPATIQFHHKNPEEKEIEISKTINQGWSKERIMTEINKCQILCANCHFKLHYNLAKGQRLEL